MTRFMIIVMYCLALAAPAWAGLDEGVAAYERGDYKTAMREFRPLAEQGDAAAQIELGRIYRNVQKDYVEAARRFYKAATQKFEYADIYLEKALITLTELGLDAFAGKDFASALRLLQPAAEMGSAEAPTFLGIIHYDGLGVLQNYQEAKKWFLMGADPLQSIASHRPDDSI